MLIDSRHHARQCRVSCRFQNRTLTCSLYCNSRILHGVRNKRDVAMMTEDRRHRLILAVKGAEKLVAMCLRSQQVSADKVNKLISLSGPRTSALVSRRDSLWL